MSEFRNILELQTLEYNRLYKQACKIFPSYSIDKKRALALNEMMSNRKLDASVLTNLINIPFTREYQYALEVVALNDDMENGIPRYYLKDDSLFEFFENTEIKRKEVQSILDSLDTTENCSFWGVCGKTFSFLLCYTKTTSGKHIVSVFTNKMNFTFCVEDYDRKNPNGEIYNLGLNFLFYINAFPQCVIDGVPNGVKKNPKGKVISTSDKIISHTTVEHGFVRPHFRSGYFRHLNSDYFVNCKGQVRFIESTMVKGSAKTVIKGDCL